MKQKTINAVLGRTRYQDANANGEITLELDVHRKRRDGRALGQSFKLCLTFDAWDCTEVTKALRYGLKRYEQIKRGELNAATSYLDRMKAIGAGEEA